MKLFQTLRDGGMFAGYMALLLTVVVLGANGLAMFFG